MRGKTTVLTFLPEFQKPKFDVVLKKWYEDYTDYVRGHLTFATKNRWLLTRRGYPLVAYETLQYSTN